MAIADLRETSLPGCIYPLSQPLPLTRCGGKAWHLARMLELNLPVPAGIVITSEAFEAFVDGNGLRGPVDELLHGIESTDPASNAATARRIQGLVAEAGVPTDVLDSLRNALPQLTSAKLAVRSSAIGEDSAEHSFAGQLDSVLNVACDMESVVAALKSCWASYWSERAITYQRSRGVSLRGMAVVVQEQVPAALSGVLFTRHPGAAPDQSQRDWMVAEFCVGLGDMLVSGQITPGRLRISRTTAELRREVSPERTSEAESPVLLDETAARALAGFGSALEDAFGGPQDVEWSIDHDGRLFLLQSRPITASAASTPPRPKEGQTLVVWSNANVNENFPDPISPLLYSIASLGYHHYFRNLGIALGISRKRIAAMEQPLRNLVGVHGARLYYNLTNIHAVLRMAPFGELLADSFNQFVGAENTKPAGGRLTWNGFSRSRVAQSLEVVRIAGSGLWQFLLVGSRVARFERTIDAFAAKTAPAALDRESLLDLLGHLRRFLTIRCHHWLDASLADAAAMISYGLLKRMLEAECPGEGNAALHNSLLKGLRDVVSGTPAARLWELSREIRADPELRGLFADEPDEEVLSQLARREEFAPFRDRFGQFIDEWGFRCSGELMLTVPGFQERPAAVVEILRAYVALECESPLERLSRQAAERELETQRVYQELRGRKFAWYLPWPGKKFVLKRLLHWTQRAIVLRERARLKQALLYSRCRRIVLAIGERLVRAGTFQRSDDVFFLTVQELDDLLSGQSMFPAHAAELVALRRSAHAQLSRQRPPDTFSIPVGEYWNSIAEGAGAQELPAGDAGTCLRGSGVCGGVATARAAVLDQVTELHKLSAGDILVTRQTDPGWGPVFPLIRGLIMERGGMLSHGAILAREYGLPTVVGIPDVTRRIAPGQIVTVNGDRGLVEFT
jgi:pyruvate,water dikinase